MILIISSDDDVHALAVMHELSQMGVPHLLLNTADFPAKASIIIEPGLASPTRVIRYRGRDIDLAQVTSVWWRRPQPYQMHAELTDPVADNFAIRELDEAIEGLYLMLDATWLNEPGADQRASRKVWQQRIAQESGLEVPETLITNDPASARAFVARQGPGRTIYKAFQGSEDAWRETRLLKPEEEQKLDSVKFAPVIFQSCIDAQFDIRATIVGDQIFAGAIHSQSSAYKVDFRMDMDVEISPVTLQPSAAEGLKRLMRRMGLVYGAVDFRRTPDGRDVFIEINPAGQWLFVEHKTGQPISRAVAEALLPRAEKSLAAE